MPGDPGGGQAADRRNDAKRRAANLKRTAREKKQKEARIKNTTKSEKGAYKREKYVAGQNIVGRKKAQVEDSFLKRADDPRNWEFHYKEDSYVSVGKQDDFNSSADRSRAQNKARRSQAEKKAKSVGTELYDVMKIEFETKEIRSTIKDDRSKSLAGRKRAGTTRVGRGVAAQKQAGERRSGRATARASTPFDAPSKRRTSRIA